MGVLEREFARRHKRSELKKTILNTLVITGVVLLAGGGLARAMMRSSRRKYQPSSISRSLKSLLDAGYVAFDNTPHGRKLRITKKGGQYLEVIEAGEMTLPKPKKWDNKFRVVIFDIKEKRSNDRKRLREFLRQLGFMRLQNSVWVYPYDCEDLITLIKAEFQIGRDVLYMIVDSIEYDKPIREHFNLPLSK